jgi:hypothetical protein
MSIGSFLVIKSLLFTQTKFFNSVVSNLLELDICGTLKEWIYILNMSIDMHEYRLFPSHKILVIYSDKILQQRCEQSLELDICGTFPE